MKDKDLVWNIRVFEVIVTTKKTAIVIARNKQDAKSLANDYKGTLQEKAEVKEIKEWKEHKKE